MPYSTKEKKAEYQRKYREKNREELNAYHRSKKYYMKGNANRPPGQTKAAYLLRTWGLTEEEYLKILKKQGGKCFICQKDADVFKKRLAVDHDHVTMEIRGLLCTHCNRTIIGRNRNPDILYRAFQYLKGPYTGYIAPKQRPRSRRKKES